MCCQEHCWQSQYGCIAPGNGIFQVKTKMWHALYFKGMRLSFGILLFILSSKTSRLVSIHVRKRSFCGCWCILRLFVPRRVVFKDSQKLQVYLRLSAQLSLPCTNTYLKKRSELWEQNCPHRSIPAKEFSDEKRLCLESQGTWILQKYLFTPTYIEVIEGF